MASLDFKKYYYRLVRIGFALAIAFLLNQFRFDYIEAVFYDARVRTKPASSPSGYVQTVAIDPETVKQLGRVPNANDHTRLLTQLREAGAQVVIYLINPNELVGSFEELKRFADIAASFPHFYVAIPDLKVQGEDESFRLYPPFEKLIAAPAPQSRDGSIFAKDEVSRRIVLSYKGDPTMYLTVARLYNPEIQDEKKVRGLFEYLETNQAYVDFRPKDTYSNFSFDKTAQGDFPKEQVTGNIVIVGRDTQGTTKDYVKTPFSRDVVAMTTLEFHANMIDTLILNSAPIIAPPWLDLFFTCLISILAIYVVLTVKPTSGLLMLLGALVGFSLICYFAFWWFGYWIGMAHAFLSIFICYYFFIPYRLIMENRRSWEYYQKNKLLTQVEELKTNFLSMMSHDLKTPIARIQGMTDIVQTDPNPLSDRQKEAIGTLTRSADELLEFVSSILNLGRIESKELKLHVQSKDVNKLLAEIIEKFGYLAHSKKIEIVSEFEPLFSVKMDVDLMRQVFSNLIENAIKYSPESSRILITTEEDNGMVVVQVADQGMGIPEDEIGNVFMKFYRSKGAKSSTIKGSGLGLYLANYFVELHKGRISVDSSPGQGSTFTVELPMSGASAQTE